MREEGSQGWLPAGGVAKARISICQHASTWHPITLPQESFAVVGIAEEMGDTLKLVERLVGACPPVNWSPDELVNNAPVRVQLDEDDRAAVAEVRDARVCFPAVPFEGLPLPTHCSSAHT